VSNAREYGNDAFLWPADFGSIRIDPTAVRDNSQVSNLQWPPCMAALTLWVVATAAAVAAAAVAADAGKNWAREGPRHLRIEVQMPPLKTGGPSLTINGKLEFLSSLLIFSKRFRNWSFVIWSLVPGTFPSFAFLTSWSSISGVILT